MAKLTFLLASFVALLFLADASIYQTTVTVNEEQANPTDESCGGDLQMMQNLWPCRDYVRQRVSGFGLRPGFNRYLSQCCNNLRRMPTPCRCQGLMITIGRQFHGWDARQAYRVAQDLPNKCGVPPQICPFPRQLEF